MTLSVTHAMTDAQRIAFETNGSLVIPEALSTAELREVRAAADRAEQTWRADLNHPGIRSNTLDEVIAPIEYDDVLLRLMWHPKVFPLVREAIGDDVMMIDNSYYITPPHTPRTHADWHHDVGQRGVYHPMSILMAKVFYLLSDVGPNSGGTAMIPGSHRLPMNFEFPHVSDPKQMPGIVQMTGKAGTAYMFNGRIYHAAVNNESDVPRRVLIFNYGHLWMKQWPGYEPSQRLLDEARASGDPVRMQLLGLGHAYSSYLKL
jgi:ectoine hydroxylase-related dioxygenase (phytanoyl-CoA dioxygenase family)